MSSWLRSNMKWPLPFPQTQNSIFEVLNNTVNFFHLPVSILLFSQFKWKGGMWAKKKNQTQQKNFREAFLALFALKIVKESWSFRFPEWELFLVYMADITWSTKRLVQISAASLKLVRPCQRTAAEDLGLIVWSCLYFGRDFTWHLGISCSTILRVFTCLAWRTGFNGILTATQLSQVFQWSSSSDDLHLSQLLRWRMNTSINYSF